MSPSRYESLADYEDRADYGLSDTDRTTPTPTLASDIADATELLIRLVVPPFSNDRAEARAVVSRLVLTRILEGSSGEAEFAHINNRIAAVRRAGRQGVN
jgi:hypothetical protein